MYHLSFKLKQNSAPSAQNYNNFLKLFVIFILNNKSLELKQSNNLNTISLQIGHFDRFAANLNNENFTNRDKSNASRAKLLNPFETYFSLSST